MVQETVSRFSADGTSDQAVEPPEEANQTASNNLGIA